MIIKNKRTGFILLEYSTYLINLYYLLISMNLSNNKIFNCLFEMIVTTNILIDSYLIK